MGQFCKKAADAVSEFYEEHKTAINIIAGVALIAVCAVATVATGGACGFAFAVASNALKGAIWGAVTGAIGGLVNGAVEYYEENGTLDGSGQHLLESTAEGFATGAAGGALGGGAGGAVDEIFKYAKSASSFCFVAGTLIVTADGTCSIEDVKIGDKVLSTDPETGETTEKTVLQTFERQTTEFVDVTIGGETYTTTPEHPFYVEGKDFVNASELEVGDKVVCYDTETDTTETKEVEEVHSFETDEPVTVYNFEVHEYHTYHVGEDGVLVHNACKNLGGNGSRYRQGQPVAATEKTLEMALDPESYANAIAKKYGINLRGSGQEIKIKYNPELRPGIYGRTRAVNPNIIEIGADALINEKELANTIAHELNHARDFLRGGIAPEAPAYRAGDALSDYIGGGR